MDDDHRELVRRLFAAATEMTETAHEAAIAGQSEALTAGDYAKAAHRLQGATRGLAALAEAAVAGQSAKLGPRPLADRAPASCRGTGYHGHRRSGHDRC